MQKRLFSLILVGTFLSVGCEEDKKSRVSVPGISAPEVKPKVASATPSTLSSTALVEEAAPTNPAASLKSRIFGAAGPTAIFSILDGVDAGMNAIERQLQGAEKGPDEDPDSITSYAPCMGEIVNEAFVEKPATAFPIKFDFDGDGATDLDPGFTIYLNCYSDLTSQTEGNPSAADHNPDSKYWRGFGKKGTGDDETWYIIDSASTKFGDTTSAGGSAIEVSKNKDYVDMWFRVGVASSAETGSGVLAHLRRSIGGLIEYSHTGKGVGYGCGMHVLISKEAGLAYFKVKTDQETNGQQNSDGVAEECDTYTGERDKEYCIDISAATFTVNSSLATCTAAGLASTAFTFDTLTYNDAEYTSVYNSLNTTVPDGVELLYIADTPEKGE